ncbi:hypothetical protein [Bartonella elizabethae]|nr:hypothetical protein [Bartonella elizabethae]
MGVSGGEKGDVTGGEPRVRGREIGMEGGHDWRREELGRRGRGKGG